MNVFNIYNSSEISRKRKIKNTRHLQKTLLEYEKTERMAKNSMKTCRIVENCDYQTEFSISPHYFSTARGCEMQDVLRWGIFRLRKPEKMECDTD